MKRSPALILLLTLWFASSSRADTSLVFNEIMYHPATNEPAMEWVELYNQMAVDLDLSGWSLDGAIHYSFASNTVVHGGGFLVVALSPNTLEATSGVPGALGPFTGRLSNGGAQLLLRNNNGRIVDQVSYGVEGDWPVAPDGSGVSLAKLDHDTASAPAKNWTSSARMGGTPGRENFPAPSGAVGPDIRLLALDTSWRCSASSAGLGTGWRAPGYDDTAWAERAPLTNRPIPTLFNTGVGANGVVLAPGTPDPHYLITAAPQGPVQVPATVIQNHPAWLANNALSSWIGVQNPGTSDVSPGNYSYQTPFSLAGFLLATVRVNVTVSADDFVSDLFLNGQPTGLSFTGFTAFSPQFQLSSGFLPGINRLEFHAANGDLYPMNPHGFRAQVSGTGTSVNPNSPLPPGSTTYYFRGTFGFSGDPAYTRLTLNPVLADGAIVYLNGAEVFRWNMPPGTISDSTPALTNVTAIDACGAIVIPAASLVAGANVLAVEVHQAPGSADGPLFAADLIATPLPVPPEPPISLAFNELCPATDAPFWLELVNYGTSSLPLEGYRIDYDGSTNTEYVFPGGSFLPAGGYLALTNTALGLHPVAGDKLYLLPPDRRRVLDAVVVQNASRARSPDGTGAWLHPSLLTPGASNRFAIHTEIVINEIMYHHARLSVTNNLSGPTSSEAWIELFNRSSNVVDLTGWKLDGGISYRFPAGKTIHPGAYLVVANDAAALRSLYPAIDIIGDFSGKLSHNGDAIVLQDSSSNPANSLHYFTAGRWPAYADGGGSSLELLDPMADNSTAEAWAASSESAKAIWQTYRYRAVAQTVVGPEQWNDFIMGLMGEGECLIDDLSVVQSPTNNPVQFIANGNFENGLTGWRVLGTHCHSRVEVDPENAANHVLHLRASGPQEHMHNHIETTFANGRSVVNGQTYEISFRAKWLAGNNLLNTRLYFDRVARTSVLPMPALNGTPGARNSRFTANLGPTFSQFQHHAVIPEPGQPVTVSVVAQDPQGVSACEVWWAINGGIFSHALMNAQTGGLYTGTIPGLPAGTIVQFYVRAVDGLGAASTYPAAGPDSGALYVVADGQADLRLGHNVRIILSPANRALLHAYTNVMSNEALPCTVVYDEQRPYYDMGVRLKGSERGRYVDARVSFHLEFQPDELFRGVHPVMLIDRSGVGNNTDNRQMEMVVRHLLLRAGGLPGPQPDMCRVIAPLSAHSGSAIFGPRHEDEFIQTAYANGGTGIEWEMELIYYPLTADAAGYKNPGPDNVLGLDIADLGEDKETYRYPFILKNHRDLDDYSPMIALAKALSLPSGPALEARTKQLLDVDEWLRAFAFLSLCGIGDTYTFGGGHNLMFYLRPADQKLLVFPWDMDYLLQLPATQSLIGDQNWSKVANLPGNKRRLYAHALDLVDSCINSAYMASWVTHYARFAPGQDYSGLLSYIEQRTAAVKSEINSAGGNSPFAILGTNFIVTANNLVTLSGTAPVQVQTIRINGVDYPVTWNSVSAWTLSLPVSLPTNTLNIVGCDLHGTPLTNFAGTVTVKYTGPAPDPAGSIVINEILFNPLVPGASYVELFNTSASQSFDLSNWRLKGLNYTFPPGSLMTNRQFLVLAKAPTAFAAAYGSSVWPFDQFPGQLQADGETLTLLRPGPQTNADIVVDRVRYAPLPPWPQTEPGTALQLIDPAQDNSRVANWAVGQPPAPVSPQWVYFSTTGTASSSVLYLYLQSAGDIYLDDLSLVAGSVSEAGVNLLANPGFESSLSGTWNLTANFIPSAQSASFKHSGNASLHLVAAAAGSGNGNAIYQNITPALSPGQPYALSFWYLQSTNGGPLTLRLSGSGLTTGPVNPAPATAFSGGRFTPGATNSVATTLLPFPPLWLNELQADNLTGPTNRASQRTAWLELYNPGTNTVSLNGLYLANNYTNLTQWAFPTNATIAPGEFKLLFADGQTNLSDAAEPHTSFTLSGGAGSLALSRLDNGQPQVLDYLEYTNLGPNHSFGSFPDGQNFDRQEFVYVTPGGTNNGASAPLTVRINEWMAGNTHTLTNPLSGKCSDWFELYNYGTNTADLAGYYLTDNLTNQFQFKIPAGYSIPPHGFLLVWADGKSTSGTPDLHITFKLDKSGESLGLYGADGNPIDYVSYGPQTDDFSQGRYPDGAPGIFTMPVSTPHTNNLIPNTAPLLAPIGSKFIHAGQTLTFTAAATDPEIPFQSLTFALEAGAPSAATLEPTSGLFRWPATNILAPSTNLITMRVTDNGTPPLTSTDTFAVIVLAPPQLVCPALTGSSLPLVFHGLPGQVYQVQYKDNLSDPEWMPLTSRLPGNGSTVEINAALSGRPHRFYRLLVLP